jgi:hypothetical protein
MKSTDIIQLKYTRVFLKGTKQHKRITAIILTGKDLMKNSSGSEDFEKMIKAVVSGNPNPFLDPKKMKDKNLSNLNSPVYHALAELFIIRDKKAKDKKLAESANKNRA